MKNKTNNSQYNAGYKLGFKCGLAGKKINVQNSLSPEGIEGFNCGFHNGTEVTINEDWHNKYKK